MNPLRLISTLIGYLRTPTHSALPYSGGTNIILLMAYLIYNNSHSRRRRLNEEEYCRCATRATAQTMRTVRTASTGSIPVPEVPPATAAMPVSPPIEVARLEELKADLDACCSTVHYGCGFEHRHGRGKEQTTRKRRHQSSPNRSKSGSGTLAKIMKKKVKTIHKRKPSKYPKGRRSYQYDDDEDDDEY